jgi:hypothetical protein
MNSTITEITKTLKGTNSRLSETEEWISDLEDRMIEMIETEQNKEKKNKKKWGQSQRLLGQYWAYHLEKYRDPRRRRRKKKEFEKIFEIIVKNFSKVGKEIVTQVKEAQRVPYQINPRRNMPRHILIKLMKIKHKEQILKAERQKQQITYKGISVKLTAVLSTEILQARREG